MTALFNRRSVSSTVLLLLVAAVSCFLPVAFSAGATVTSAAIINDYTITSAAYVPQLDSTTHVLTSTTFTTDDTPNIQLPLPFTFPYWTAQTSTVYANPNGGVQFDNSYPCCNTCESSQGRCCQFMNYNTLIETGSGPISTCSFSLSYNDMLAVFLTDLAPAYPTPMATGPQLVYGYDKNALVYTSSGNSGGGGINGQNGTAVWNNNYPFIIQYKNMPLNGQADLLGIPYLPPYGVTMTFGVGLYSSGRIDYYYWNVSDPINYDGWGGLERLLLVGLRQPQGQSQQNAYLTQYYDPNTGTLPSNGTYLPRPGVKSNTTWSFWPIGSSSCVGPPYALSEGGSVLRVVVKDYINSTGNFNWTCRYVDSATNQTVASGDVAGVYNVFNDEVDCVAPPAPVNATYHLELLAASVYGAAVQLPIDPLTFTYLSNRSKQAFELTASTTSILSLTGFCASCAAFRPTICWYDCSGTLHGTAYVDNCGTCVGGSTGRSFDDALDCNGVCHGPFVELSSGECVCAGGGECDAIVESTLYVADQSASYIYSVNATVLSGNSANTSLGAVNYSGNGGDPIVDFYDERFITLPYTFTVTSDPFPFYLSFYFPFMGSTYNLIYISPMGGIFLNVPLQSCIAHASLAHFDGTNSCQYQMIAGYMAEFDDPLSSYVVPEWSFISNSKFFIARYVDMHLAESSGPRSYVSFSITLYPSGRVSINHYDVIPATEIALVSGAAVHARAAGGVGHIATHYERPAAGVSIAVHRLVGTWQWHIRVGCGAAVANHHHRHGRVPAAEHHQVRADARLHPVRHQRVPVALLRLGHGRPSDAHQPAADLAVPAVPHTRLHRQQPVLSGDVQHNVPIVRLRTTTRPARHGRHYRTGRMGHADLPYYQPRVLRVLQRVRPRTGQLQRPV